MQIKAPFGWTVKRIGKEPNSSGLKFEVSVPASGSKGGILLAHNEGSRDTASAELDINVVPGADSHRTTTAPQIGPIVTDEWANAARDADANQGPIARTASGMKITSEETSTGYRIATAIPWSVMSQRTEPGAHIGFNVLIYDGDKKDAAIGENINESRLAWSPGRGVQGRPGYWGELRLD